MRKVLVAEDDIDQLNLIQRGFSRFKDKFDVIPVVDGKQAIDVLKDEPVALLVTDIKMPRLDGMDLLRRLRRQSKMPVIFLTSKDQESDELDGLELGADDYITKPFSLSLLIERARTVLRRNKAAASPIGESETSAVLERGNLTLDPVQHLCKWGEASVTLTVTEFLLLEALVRRPGHVKSRDQLLDAGYDNDTFVDDRTIDSHIKRIRRKFRAIDPEFSQIETLYGVGYRFIEG